MKRNLTQFIFGAGLIGHAFAQSLITGPSTTVSPYMWPAAPGVSVTSILSAGDVVGGYTLSGLGDGMGVFDNGGATFTLLMNHEIGTGIGSVRAHGQPGAFISRWVINKSNLQVVSGADLIQNVKIWTGTTYTTYNATNQSTLASFGRLCAADLPKITAFYNAKTGKGTQERIFTNGEENGSEGRGFAHIVTGAEAGNSYQLPHFGRFSFENIVASPYSQDKTIAIGLDDATPGQVYVYVGNKSLTGNDIEKAGLFGGKLYGVSVIGYYNEGSSVPNPGTNFNLIEIGAPSSIAAMTGTSLNTTSNNLGITNFLRPEDGAWDPNRPTDFYFATTNSFTSPSRLWRLRFNDIENPELGGKIEAVLAGTEGPKMMDNLVMDNHGHILIQEDPGGQNHTAKIWQYKISTDVVSVILEQDSTRFKTGGANFLTIDEESSGVIDMQGILNPGWFLAFDQAHYSLASPVLEGGQLVAFYNPSSALANPEINITGNSQSIPSSNTAVSTTNNTDFGSVNIGTGTSRSFVIQNTSTGTLIVSSMFVNGTNAGDFTILGPTPPFYIGANASQSITVNFNTPITGVRNATLNIVNSDFDEGEYKFALQGSGAAPEINVEGNNQTIPSGNTGIATGNNTDFGGVFIGNNVNQTFVVRNMGTGTLSLSNLVIGGANSNEFVVTSPTVWPSSILPSGSLNLTIKFTPLALGNRNAQVMIYSNDSDEATYTYAIQGKGMTDVGVKSFTQEEKFAIVFPNPSNEEAVLLLNRNISGIHVVVKNILGQTISELSEGNCKGNELKLETAQWPAGSYFLYLQSNNGVQSIKLIVSH